MLNLGLAAVGPTVRIVLRNEVVPSHVRYLVLLQKQSSNYTEQKVKLKMFFRICAPYHARKQYGSQQGSEKEDKYVPWCQLPLGVASHMRSERSGGIGQANTYTPLLSADWHLQIERKIEIMFYVGEGQLHVCVGRGRSQIMHLITLKWLRDLWSCKLQEIVKFIQAKLPPTT